MEEELKDISAEILSVALSYSKGLFARFPEGESHKLAVKAAMSGAMIYVAGLGLQHLDESAPENLREMMKFLHDLLDHSVPAARQMVPKALAALEDQLQTIIVDTDEEGLVTIALAMPATHLTLTPSEANILIDNLIRHTAVVQ